MNTIRKIVALLMCLCMLLGMTAVAEETSAELTAETELATINGEVITWGDVESIYNSLVTEYGSYYDMADPANVELFRAVALDNTVVEVIMQQKAVELGVDKLTEEEIAQSDAAAVTDWAAAIDNYLAAVYPDLTADSPAEEIAAAEAEAAAYYLEGGYDLDVLKAEYQMYVVLDKVQSYMLQDAVVTDEDVEAYYQQLVAADKELYEGDVEAYMAYNSQVEMMAYYAAFYGTESNMDYAWYKPEGFRAVRHILLPIDETLMNTYTELQALYEEQQSAPEGEVATTEAPVTIEQVNEAKAAIFASVADKVEEINQKHLEGVDFDELITTYGVNADGTASDPGMASNPYYEICSASDSMYVSEFVEASMSIEEVGGISAPYLSSFGIHIVKYLHDIPGGPVEMTALQREAKRAELLTLKQEEAYYAALDAWMAAADIVYTGVVTPYEVLVAEEEAE